jgi:hypothetical protein
MLRPAQVRVIARQCIDSDQGKTRCSPFAKHPARQHVGRLQRNHADSQLRLLLLFAGLEVEIFEGCFRSLTCSCFCDSKAKE